MKKNVFSWFEHFEQMSEERMTKTISDGKVSGKGDSGTSVDLRKQNIKDTRGRSPKKHEDPPEGRYEEIDDIGRGERGM